MDIEAILLKFSAWLDKRGSTRMITRTTFAGNDHFPTESPYMKRHYLLSTPWFSVFLHCFFASDRDDPHDHPWASISIPLFPGFMEVTYTDPGVDLFNKMRRLIASNKWRKPFHVYYRSANAAHKIQLAEGYAGRTWSLFIHFKRTRQWGFWQLLPRCPSVVISPGQSIDVSNAKQVQQVYRCHPHLKVTIGGEQDDFEYRITNIGSGSVMLDEVPPRWNWLDFKTYGREVIGNHNIESGTVPKGQPDYKIVGHLFPRVTRATA